jgi:hypothetical protein
MLSWPAAAGVVTTAAVRARTVRKFALISPSSSAASPQLFDNLCCVLRAGCPVE